MAVTGTLGAQLFTSATPLVDVDAAADAITDFQALTLTTEVGFVEDFGELGRVFELVTFVSVAEGRTRKFKGPYNDGTMQMTFGSDVNDTGQALLYAAGRATDQNTYPFKITLVGADAYFDTMYFGAKVMSYRFRLGAANQVVRALVNLEVNTEIFFGAT